MRADIIRKYFQAWINKDIEIVKQTFSENAVYSECYGPEYHGLLQIENWFEDWNNRGQVLEWTIKRILEQNQTLIVEWYFKCDYDGMVDGFDGVTIADFDDMQFAPSGGRCCVSQRSPGAGKRSIVFMTLLFRLPQYNVWLPA